MLTLTRAKYISSFHAFVRERSFTPLRGRELWIEYDRLPPIEKKALKVKAYLSTPQRRSCPKAVYMRLFDEPKWEDLTEQEQMVWKDLAQFKKTLHAESHQVVKPVLPFEAFVWACSVFVEVLNASTLKPVPRDKLQHLYIDIWKRHDFAESRMQWAYLAEYLTKVNRIRGLRCFAVQLSTEPALALREWLRLSSTQQTAFGDRHPRVPRSSPADVTTLSYAESAAKIEKRSRIPEVIDVREMEEMVILAFQCIAPHEERHLIRDSNWPVVTAFTDRGRGDCGGGNTSEDVLSTVDFVDNDQKTLPRKRFIFKRKPYERVLQSDEGDRIKVLVEVAVKLARRARILRRVERVELSRQKTAAESSSDAVSCPEIARRLRVNRVRAKAEAWKLRRAARKASTLAAIQRECLPRYEGTC